MPRGSYFPASDGRLNLVQRQPCLFYIKPKLNTDSMTDTVVKKSVSFEKLQVGLFG